MSETLEPAATNEPAARAPDGSLLNQNSAQAAPNPSSGEPTPPEPNAAPEPKAGAPEAYTDFTAPEGHTLDKDAIASASALFKELNLTQEQAQKLVTLQAQRDAGFMKAGREAFETTNAQWQKDARDEWGTRLESEVIPIIGRALDSLPEDVRKPFREAMDMTGVGNNPAFIRVFYEFAKRTNEGRAVSPTGVAPPPNNRARPGFAESMYPGNTRQ